MRWLLCSLDFADRLLSSKEMQGSWDTHRRTPHLHLFLTHTQCRGEQREKPCFQSVISSLLLSSHRAGGLQKEPSGPAPGDSTAAIDSVKGFQSCQEGHNPGARTDQQGKVEQGRQQQTYKDPHQHTVDGGDHPRRCEEDLPPGWA